MRIFLLILVFCFSNLKADLIVLKNGEEVEGAFLSETPTDILFDVNGQKKSYLKTKIKTLELGYSGSSFCYILETEPDKEICDMILHRVDESKMIVGKGKGVVNKEEFSLKNVKQFSIKNVQKKNKLAAVLNKGINLKVKLDNQEIDVEIDSTQPKDGKILYKPTSAKETAIQEIRDEQIKEIHWKRDPRTITQKILGGASLAIPGFFQYPGNRWKGVAMFGLFLVLGAAIPVEYGNAQKALNADQDILVYNNNLLFVNGLGSNPEFEAHKRNMNAAMGGLGLLFAYHAYDVYKTTRDDKGNMTTIQLQWSLPTQDPLFIGQRNANIPIIGLKFSYSF